MWNIHRPYISRVVSAQACFLPPQSLGDQCNVKLGMADRKYKIKIHTTQLTSASRTELTVATEHTLSQGCSPSPCRGHWRGGRICLSVSAWRFMLLCEENDGRSAAGKGIRMLPRRMQIKGVKEWSKNGSQRGENPRRGTCTDDGITEVKTSWGSEFKNMRQKV